MGFWEAMTTKNELTENLMPTHSTSGSFLLDWFYKMGGTRQLEHKEIVSAFLPALAEDRRLALRSVFALRNIRGGMGERRAFRVVARWLAYNEPETIQANMENIPYYGRWDDILYVCLGTPAEDTALLHIWKALQAGDGLCAKWMPREGKSLHEVAIYLADKFGLSRKEYRKLLVKNTDVVETQMCDQQWDDIKFDNVPSVAFKKYRKAFQRHQPDRFAAFIEEVLDGEKEVHAGAIFPHDIIREYLQGFNGYYSAPAKVSDAAEAQWASLPEYDMPSGTLVIPDTSGSMYGEPLEVAVSLGIYFSERLTGPFKNLMVTFSARPTFHKMPDSTLRDKVMSTAGMNWDMNTNLEAVFKMMLNKAIENNLSPEEMPGTLLIISDMQFDRCIAAPGDSAMEMIRGYYNAARYEVPNVIFWNVRTSRGVPAKTQEKNVALLSGFSPSLMKAVMQGIDSPIEVMKNTLEDEQYDRVVV